MTTYPAAQRQYELDRSLLDEHGPSYIDTVRSFADVMRREGREKDADDLLSQCERMRAILRSDQTLFAPQSRANKEE